MRFAFFVFCAILAGGAAPAQVPDSGRWQELRFSREDVHEQFEDRYVELVVGLAARQALDRDRGLLRRVQRIGATLVAAAVSIKPESASWKWEFHVTDEPSVEALCIAGGKLLVGSALVRRLALTDAELAILLAHEMAHAIAEHHREVLSEALFINPQPSTTLAVMIERLDSDLSMQLRLAALSNLQEREADQLGMVLAHRAGWPVTAMISFYEKLAATDVASLLAGGHPALASRVSMAKGMARLLGP